MPAPRWILLPLILAAPAHGAPGFYRSPSLHGDTVVFTAEGDLWKVPVTGGDARRLTSHPGSEWSAAISPDGKSVAFAGQYEGPTEVYVMPLDGGLPRRLTWQGEGALPVAWTPEGRVLCSTRAYSTLPDEQLVSIDPATGDESLLPLAQASEGIFDESGKRLFFTRLPFQGSSTKRYQGGTAQNLWRYDEGAAEAVPLTADFPGTSKNPMWWQGRVYFLSDRSGLANLWSMLPDGSDLKPHTRHTDYEARHAWLDQGRIIYQYGGTLHLYTIADDSDREIPINLPSDFDQMRERWVAKPLEYLTSARISPDGDRIVLTARGSVFVAPVKPGGRFIEIPRNPGVRYREAGFFPDGKSLLAQTDETGEIEMVRLPADGLGAPELLTRDGTIFRFPTVVSPDGKRVAWQDKNLDLWTREVGGSEPKKIATGVLRPFDDLSWSPDGQWLAFVDVASNSFPRIRLYRAADGLLLDATGERVMSSSPAWSPDGRWLYFLSDRELRSLVGSPWGPRQPEPFFTESTRIYALSLQKDNRLPFDPPDELHPANANGEKDKDKPDKPADKPAEKPAPPALDPDGLAGRLFEVPGASGNLSDLVVTAKHLFFVSRPPGVDSKARLMRLDINSDAPQAKVFVEDVGSWDLSADRKQLLVRKGENFHVVPAEGDCPAKLEKPVPLDRWTFNVNPREEWRQIYREAWRMLRDFFYDPQMHGLDWPAVRRKYEPLVDRVAERGDLNEILQEMAGELGALHTVVQFGDQRKGQDTIVPASLGARLVRDPAAGGWRVEHVFVSDPDYPGKVSPLARPGVNVRDGEVIVAINGRPLVNNGPHPEELLAQQAGQPVMLEVRAAAGGATRRVLVKPLAPEAARDLRYAEWEYTRRQETEKLGQGAIGYVHLRAMGAGSILEWARDFYPVFNRQGLIIDMRHNRGGNTDSWILGRLLRKAWFHWSARAGQPYPNMQYAFRGHVTVLCNEWTASDGEAFSEGFRRLGLGKVIGTRTWGGQIWLDSRRWLIDNGMCTAAEIGVYGPEGRWLIEGHGVDPDIVVDNAPHATFLGKDAQLEAAVRHLQQLIAEDPRPVPPVPPRPDKSEK